MPEQMTIRERLEWLAEDRENRVLRLANASLYALLPCGTIYRHDGSEWMEPKAIRDSGQTITVSTLSLFLDERQVARKLYRPTEKTELEKAEAELEKWQVEMRGFLHHEKITSYIEARLKVERLRAEESK